MTDIDEPRRALVRNILEGDGRAAQAQRRAAFDNAGLAEPLKALVDKVAGNAYRVTDRDFDAARGAGLSEDQIFEIVVCAAVGEATRQYESAIAALDAATGKN
jgi:hypothetical protein